MGSDRVCLAGHDAAPGDLIFTGTPGGVGLASKPPRLLAVGDVVRREIDKLGAIENKVVAEV